MNPHQKNSNTLLFFLGLFFTPFCFLTTSLAQVKSESTKDIIELLIDNSLTNADSNLEKTNRDKKSLIKIKSTEVPIEIEWDPIEGAKNYELHVFNQEKKLIKKNISATNIFEIQLKPGRYLLRARVSDDRLVWGEWSDWTEFKVLATLPEPFLTKKILFANCRDWRALGGRLQADFYYKNYLGTQWKKIFSGDSKDLKKMLLNKTPPPGFYRFEVRATNEGWKDSIVMRQDCQRKPTLSEVEQPTASLKPAAKTL